MFHNKDYNNQNGVVVDSLVCKYINNIDFTKFYNQTISGLFVSGGSNNNDIICNNLNCNIDATIAGQLNTYALIINYGKTIIDNYGNISTDGTININNNNIYLNGINGDITCGLINGHNIQTIAQMVYDNFYVNLSTPKISTAKITTLEIIGSPNSTLGETNIYNLTISNFIYSPNATINDLIVNNSATIQNATINNLIVQAGSNITGDTYIIGDLNVNNIGTDNIFCNFVITKNLAATNSLGDITSVLDGNDSSITTNSINFKNTTGTSLLKIESGVTTINSVNSFQFFKRQMLTNTATYTSSTKYFFSGIKVINLSFSHFCSTLGTGSFTLTLLLKNGATTLQTITQNYALSVINQHLSQSFQFLTNNIVSQNITMTITISPVSTAVYASDGNNYLTCIMYNLSNTVN